MRPCWIGPALNETIGYLQDLIRIDTTNPPGNESAAARYLAERLAAEGVAAEVVEPAPGRGSVVARLRAEGSRPEDALLLLSHLDVVPAEPAGWRRDPFGGELVDGEVWGRGALDTKSLTALWLTLFLKIKREKLPLRRDLIFAATADEEMGGALGVRWLVENRPELLEAGWCLNEGGGFAVELGGVTYYPFQSAEKSPCWMTLRVRGTPGHASMPRRDNAVVRLAEAVARIGRARLPFHLTGTARLFVEGLAAVQEEPMAGLIRSLLDPERADAVLDGLPDDNLAAMLRAMLRNTASPTVLRAGEKTNVIPSIAEAQVDCRILPGQTPASIRRELLAALEGGPEVELELGLSGEPTESPVETELAASIERALARHSPGAHPVPFLVPGATDSRFLRPRGVVCYGFAPTLPDVDIRLIHGHNERIGVNTLDFALAVLADVLAGFALEV
ncbi:MAG: M20/M25/M40 family metallo-hydrolase [bacterium]|nr:M20/M25/M40 family metallo-hydrolase [bacterium]